MKRVLWLGLCLVIIVCMAGCGKHKIDEKEEVTTLKPEKTIAIHAGDIQVFLDEAKYYAYTAQATYEAYYISEGKNIDWDDEMANGVSWQQGVKSTVLDDACRRECMYSKAQEYNVSLTEEEEKEIDIAIKKYYSETNQKLMSKIGIKENRLKVVFQKAKIAEKVEEIMLSTDKKLPDETYEKWKTGNTVTAEEQWKTITFNQHIFTLEDIE